MITRRQFLIASGVAGAGTTDTLEGKPPTGLCHAATRWLPRPSVDPEIPNAPSHPAGNAAETGRCTARGAWSTTTRSPSGSSSSRSCRRLPHDDGVELRLGQSPGYVQLPRLHHRSQVSTGRCGSSGSTTWSTPVANSCRTSCRWTRRCTGPTRQAAPPAETCGRRFASTPEPYTGPVPIVTHLHGGHNAQESDGYAEAWYLPAANEHPRRLRHGGHLVRFLQDRVPEQVRCRSGSPARRPSSIRTTSGRRTFWYHDHTLGMTRLNVYAGPAGFYLLRRGPGDLPDRRSSRPAPGVGADPFGRFYEIPIAIQDRSFNADGSLFYPDSREFFDEFAGPYIPDSDVSPIWNPEFFGNTMVVNGRTWPFLEVEPRRYRFRFLNGCNSRFLILKIVTNPLATRPASAALPFWQIGTRGRISARAGDARSAPDGSLRTGRCHRRLHGVPRGNRALPHQRGP